MKRNVEIHCVLPSKTGVTRNYSQFSRMPGNRPVSPKHVREIESAAEIIGMLAEEIIVNEKFEILDGQHRFEVLKKYGFPIRYAMFKGLGVGQCTELNINQRNWTLMDYVSSYAEAGNINYIRLNKLVQIASKGGRKRMS